MDKNTFERQYKNVQSGVRQWNEASHADDWAVSSGCIGLNIAINETALSNGSLYAAYAKCTRRLHPHKLTPHPLQKRKVFVCQNDALPFSKRRASFPKTKGIVSAGVGNSEKKAYLPCRVFCAKNGQFRRNTLNLLSEKGKQK